MVSIKKLVLLTLVVFVSVPKETKANPSLRSFNKTCGDMLKIGWLMGISGSIGTIVFYHLLQKVIKCSYEEYREKYAKKGLWENLVIKCKYLSEERTCLTLYEKLIFVISLLFTLLLFCEFLPQLIEKYIENYKLIEYDLLQYKNMRGLL